MSSNQETVTLDLRGEVCPTPLVKAMEAMRTAPPGQEIEILTDFLPAVLAVSNTALKEGWDISIQQSGSQTWRVHLTRAGNSGTET